MLTLIYTNLASLARIAEPQYLLSMLSLYPYANGIFADMPNFALLDLVLGGVTLFHMFVAWTFFSVSDAIYKKPMMTFTHYLAKTFYGIPYLVPMVNVSLLLLTARLCFMAYISTDSSEITLRAVVSAYTMVSSIFLQKLVTNLITLGVERTLEREKEMERTNIRNWTPPPHWTTIVFAPLNLILRPEISGAENIKHDSPGFYVTNHALFGLEMAPFVATVFAQTNIFLRGLSDHFHFGHFHGEVIRFFGGVDGTRQNVDCLMESKQNVLVYPGGCHEILKPTTVPKYSLMWKERLGFVKMAIKHGYPIVPCCSVGTEDMFDRLFDLPLDFVRKGLQLPVIAPVLPHRLQKVYFWFGEPIATAQYKGDWENDELCRKVRDQVKAAVEAGIQEMKVKQAADPNRFLLQHMVNATKDAINTVVDFATGASFVVSVKKLDNDESSVVPSSKKAD